MNKVLQIITVGMMIGTVSLQSMVRLKEGYQATTGALGRGYQAAKGAAASARTATSRFWQEQIKARTTPAIQSLNKSVHDLSGLMGCMETNSCNPNQLKMIKRSIQALKVAVAGGILAAVIYGLYRGAQKYGPHIKMASLNVIESLKQQLDQYGQSVLLMAMQIYSPTKKWNDADWQKFKERFNDKLTDADKLSIANLERLRGILNKIAEYGAGVGMRAADLVEEIGLEIDTRQAATSEPVFRAPERKPVSGPTLRPDEPRLYTPSFATQTASLPVPVAK